MAWTASHYSKAAFISSCGGVFGRQGLVRGVGRRMTRMVGFRTRMCTENTDQIRVFRVHLWHTLWTIRVAVPVAITVAVAIAVVATFVTRQSACQLQMFLKRWQCVGRECL
jgi:hypothetical protein